MLLLTRRLLRTLKPPARQRGEHVGEGAVLAHDVDAGEAVHVDGTDCALFAGDEAGDECPGAVVEGDVVRVGGDAVFVKGDEDVDVGGGLVRVRGSSAGGGVGCECAVEKVRDFAFFPDGSHRVGELLAVGFKY